jgi:hypothetical protein
VHGNAAEPKMTWAAPAPTSEKLLIGHSARRKREQGDANGHGKLSSAAKLIAGYYGTRTDRVFH